MSERRVYQVEERPPLKEALPLSIQHMFAMFGASVLVPTLFGIDPAVALFMNGFGTLLYIFLTKGKAPAFLGSSFAFIAPTFLIINNSQLGFRYALAGYVVSGLLFCVIAGIIYKFGSKWIDIALPPAAMGPVVALIGLELAGTAASNGGMIGDVDPKNAVVFIVTLAVAVFGSVLFRKFFSVIPILLAILAGYALSMALGLVDYTLILEAPLFALPNFQLPLFDFSAIMIILPATLVVLSEHIGHQLVTGQVVGRDIVKDPGLHRTLLGDGLSTAISGFMGSVPTTTYGENIGVMAITRVYSVWVIGGAAIISILVAFIGKISSAIQTIPGPVMGGVSFLLYGMIATSGIRLMVESKVDYNKSRNLSLTSVVLVVGLSGISISLGEVQLTGMALAAIVAMVLSLVFHFLDKYRLTNE
ncbi:MAG: uracil permease [Clostridiales bacterium]|jgi:uracil permease|nr:uracil permease [Clostridiales bacterium]MDR2749512.1 uracil permease [Clostridiales bacterium]